MDTYGILEQLTKLGASQLACHLDLGDPVADCPDLHATSAACLPANLPFSLL